MQTDSVEEIKNKLDVKEVISGYLKLEKSGINYKAQCPFHKEKTPSFFVSQARQIWRCFGCGEGGDIFSFVQKIEGVEFIESLRSLGRKAGVEIQSQDPKIRNKKNKSLEICELVAKYFHHQLGSKNGNFILEYFKNIGITESTINLFELGYAPVDGSSLITFLKEKGYTMLDLETAGIVYKKDTGTYIIRFCGRIIFPILNSNGDVIGFGGRKLTDELAKKMGRSVISDSSKYINSPQTNIYDKSKILYGLDKAKIAIRQENACIVVEGYTDVILTHQAGYKNVVASSGTSLTNNHLTILSRFTKNMFTAFDMDVAGDSATRRGIESAVLMGFDVRIISLKDGYDPANIILENEKEWKDALKNAKSITQFYFDSVFKKYDASTPEGKREIGKELADILKNIPNRIEQAHWVQKLAKKLTVSQEDVWEEVKKASINENLGLKDENANRYNKNSITKKELLQQYVISYSGEDLRYAKKALKKLYKINCNKKLIQLFESLAKDTSKKERLKKISEFNSDISNVWNKLAFEAEIMPESSIWSFEVFDTYLNNYVIAILDEDIENLHNKISENENGKASEEEINALVEEIQLKSQQKHFS